jgi:hypothetical protein
MVSVFENSTSFLQRVYAKSVDSPFIISANRTLTVEDNRKVLKLDLSDPTNDLLTLTLGTTTVTDFFGFSCTLLVTASTDNLDFDTPSGVTLDWNMDNGETTGSGTGEGVVEFTAPNVGTRMRLSCNGVKWTLNGSSGVTSVAKPHVVINQNSCDCFITNITQNNRIYSITSNGLITRINFPSVTDSTGFQFEFVVLSYTNPWFMDTLVINQPFLGLVLEQDTNFEPADISVSNVVKFTNSNAGTVITAFSDGNHWYINGLHAGGTVFSSLY